MKMHILYFHQYFNTLKGSGGVRSYEFARRWVREGHEVHIVTGNCQDSSFPDHESFKIEGINVTVLDVYYNNKMGFLSRIRSFIRYAVKASIIAINARQYDVILATSTPLTVAIPALFGKWIAKRKIIFEVRDVWPDAAIDAGIINNLFLIFFAKILEKAIYLSSHIIVPLSTGMLKRIKNKGVDEAKMIMIPNCSDISLFNPNVNGKILRQKFKSNNKFIALYIGSTSTANYCEYIIMVAEKLKKYEEIVFWIVGDGNRLDNLKNDVKKRNLNNIVFFGRQPKEIIPYFTATANIGLVTFIAKPVFYDNSPNKFFDYIAAGLPVLFNRTTWLEKYLNEYQNGIICDPYTPSTMADNILFLMKNPIQCEAMAKQSRKLAIDVFSRDRMSQRYIKIMYSLLD